MLAKKKKPVPVEDLSGKLPSLNLVDYSDKYENVLEIRNQLGRRVTEIQERHAVVLADPSRRSQFIEGMNARAVGAPLGQVPPSFLPAELATAVKASGMSIAPAARSGCGAEFAEEYCRGLAEIAEIEGLLANTEGNLSSARLEASREICAEIEPEYRRRVEALGLALIAAAQAHSQYQELADKLNASDVAWSTLRAMPFRPVNAADNQSRLRFWLREAIEYGFINAAAVPVAWRK